MKKYYFLGLILIICGVGYLTQRKPLEPFESNLEELGAPSQSELNATHWAEIDASGTVLRVIVADYNFIQSGSVGDPANWVATYNDGSVRGNYAGKGYTYDKTIDQFKPVQPYNKWNFNPSTARWESPVAKPKRKLNSNQMFIWNEEIENWEIMEYSTVGNTDVRVIKQTP